MERTQTQIVLIEPHVISGGRKPAPGHTQPRPIEAKVRHRIKGERDGQPVTLLGVTWEGQDNVVYVDENVTDLASYEASISVDHDAFESPEDSAEALIDWLRSDVGPMHVVVTNPETRRRYVVEVNIGDDGRAHGKLPG